MQDMATVADNVTAYLRANKPKAYCDDCIAKAVKAKRRQQAQQATGALEGAGFQRTVRRCDGCGSTAKKAISL
jgi:hypothetical protein